MRFASHWLRVELRSSGRYLVVVALLVSIATGLVLAAAAGARRGETAPSRLAEETFGADVEITPGDRGLQPEKLRALPEVAELSSLVKSSFRVVGASATHWTPGEVENAPTAWVRMDDAPVEIPAVLEGRAANPDAPNEVVVTRSVATSLGKRIGDALPVRLFSAAQVDGDADADDPAGPIVDMTIVGIVRSTEFLDFEGERPGHVIATTGFFRAHQADILGTKDVAYVTGLVRLRGGAAAIPAFNAKLASIDGADTESANLAAVDSRNERSARVEARFLLIFGLVVAGVSAVALGQLLARNTGARAAVARRLTAAGLRRREAVLATSFAPVLAVALGTGLGLGTALVASRWTPIGNNHYFEPDPGLRADWPVLGGGAAVAFLLLAGATLTGAVVASGSGPVRDPRRRWRLVPALARRVSPPALSLGVRFALEPKGGPERMPTRPALAGAIAGVAGVVVALVVASGVTDGVGNPARFGQPQQIAASLGSEGEESARAETIRQVFDVLVDDPDVVAVDDGRFGSAQAGSEPLPLFTYAPVRDAEYPVAMVAGHLPRASDEITLAPEAARRLHAGTGSTVVVTGRGSQHQLRVAGIGFVPEETNLWDDGAWLTPEGFAALVDGFEEHSAYVVLRPGVDVAGWQQRAAHTVAGIHGARAVEFFPAELSDLDFSLRTVHWLPLTTEVFLGLLAVAACGYALTSVTRRRAAEIAVVRALGMTPGQIRWTVRVQSLIVVVIGLFVGVPLGLLVGQSVWSQIARSIPMQDVRPWPSLALALLAPAAIAVGLLLASWPARRATRSDIVGVLRAE